MQQQSDDVDDLFRAWTRFLENCGIRTLIGLLVALIVVLGAVNAALTGLTGHNIAVDFFHWLTSHLNFLLSPLTTPIWLIAALALLVLVLAAIVAVLGERYHTSRRNNERAVEDAHQWKERARREAEQAAERGSQYDERALRDSQKKDILGRTLEHVEQTGFEIVKAMERVMVDEHAIKKVLLDRDLSDADKVRRLAELVVISRHEIEAVLQDPILSDARKAYRMASLHHPIEGVLNRLLEAAIIHALYLVGERDDYDPTGPATDTRFNRGSILVPVSPETPYLVRCADWGWIDQEKSLEFHILNHPYNTSGQKSVAGAAFRDNKVEICRRNPHTHEFQHPEFRGFHAHPHGLEPYETFIAFPLQADHLFLTEEADKRVLGVVCLDSSNPLAFEGSPLLNQPTPKDIPVIRIMRVMYYLLQWREHARLAPR